MLTAAVRDLQLGYPHEYSIGVETHFPELWLNNPYAAHVRPAQRVNGGVEAIDCSRPPLFEQCVRTPRHYVESMHDLLSKRLGVAIPLTRT